MRKQVQSPIKKPTPEELIAELREELKRRDAVDNEFRKSTIELIEEYHDEVVRLRDLVMQSQQENFVRQQNARKQFKSE